MESPEIGMKQRKPRLGEGRIYKPSIQLPFVRRAGEGVGVRNDRDVDITAGTI